jgi:hypothetical protein
MAEDYRPWIWEIPESDESIKRSMVPGGTHMSE